MANIQTFLQNILSARYGKDVRQSIHDAIVEIDGVADTAQTSATAQAEAARKSAQTSELKAEAAATSEANAKTYMEAAGTSEANAKVSETNAKASENSAKEYENSAKLTEERAREVFESIPEDYSTISNDLYELAIKETASGEEIHVNDSSNLKLREFALYGKAKQNTTTGKNLLENTSTSKTSSGITYTVNENKSVVLKGTNAVSNVIAFIINDSVILPKGTYKVSCFTNGGYSTYRMNVYRKSDSTILAQQTTAELSITLEEEMEVQVRIIVSGGATVDATAYPMISADGGEYEPYTNGASPNPQYPQPIEVSGESGSVAVKSCGKNFLQNTAESKTENNITFTVNDDKSVTFNSSKSEAVSMFYLNRKFLLKKGKYILSGGTYNKYTFIRINYAVDGGAVVAETINGDAEFTLEKDAECKAYIRLQEGENYSNVTFYPMISKEGGEYEPYKETLATIPTENGLAGIKVSSGGNYTDSNGQQWICDEVVKYADGSGEYIQKTLKKRVLSSLDWVYSTITNRFWAEDESFELGKVGEVYPNAICTHFSKIKQNDTYTDLVFSYINQNGSGYAYRYNALNGSVDAWKEFLDENEVYIVGLLATPIITPLTAEEIAEIEKLHTFYPVTNISNDFDCGMSVTYYADSKNYIDKKISELATAMVNNI